MYTVCGTFENCYLKDCHSLETDIAYSRYSLLLILLLSIDIMEAARNQTPGPRRPRGTVRRRRESVDSTQHSDEAESAPPVRRWEAVPGQVDIYWEVERPGRFRPRRAGPRYRPQRGVARAGDPPRFQRDDGAIPHMANSTDRGSVRGRPYGRRGRRGGA